MISPDFDKTVTPVIMVDLNKVQIGELTNLPAEIKKAKSGAQSQAQEAPAPVVNKTPPTAAQKPEPVEPAKPKEEPAPKDSVAVQAPKPAEKPEPKKDKKKPEPKKTTPPSPSKSASSSDLKSLLASVDKIKKPAGSSTGGTATGAASGQTGTTGQEVQEGIKGGTGGSMMQPLTISEKDLIVTKLRGCWNVDAGATGIEDMIVEVRTYVNKEGRVKDVKIVNMQNNPSFRSVAESARRAVYICDTLGDESPFKMLADKRPENYDDWKEIFVRFRPLDGGVF